MTLEDQAKEINILITEINTKFNLDLEVPIVGITSMAGAQLITIKNMHIVMEYVLNK